MFTTKGTKDRALAPASKGGTVANSYRNGPAALRSVRYSGEDMDHLLERRMDTHDWLNELTDRTLQRIALSGGVVALPHEAEFVLQRREKSRAVQWAKAAAIIAAVGLILGGAWAVFTYVVPPKESPAVVKVKK